MVMPKGREGTPKLYTLEEEQRLEEILEKGEDSVFIFLDQGGSTGTDTKRVQRPDARSFVTTDFDMNYSDR